MNLWPVHSLTQTIFHYLSHLYFFYLCQSASFICLSVCLLCLSKSPIVLFLCLSVFSQRVCTFHSLCPVVAFSLYIYSSLSFFNLPFNLCCKYGETEKSHLKTFSSPHCVCVCLCMCLRERERQREREREREIERGGER